MELIAIIIVVLLVLGLFDDLVTWLLAIVLGIAFVVLIIYAVYKAVELNEENKNKEYDARLREQLDHYWPQIRSILCKVNVTLPEGYRRDVWSKLERYRFYCCKKSDEAYLVIVTDHVGTKSLYKLADSGTTLMWKHKSQVSLQKELKRSF